MAATRSNTRRAGVSPYEAVLGAELAGLHPRLRTYFAAIPAGRVGWGHGVFDTVGTPRRWLWPALRLLGLRGIVFAGWHHDVPFTVINRPATTVDGAVAVRAVRTFSFTAGARQMVDAITAEPNGLVDHLGRGRPLSAHLDARVEAGSLRMTSTGLLLRVGFLTVPIPAALAPRVELTERFDDVIDRQRVTVTLTMPVIGRIYEYSGSFDYRVVPADEVDLADIVGTNTPGGRA